MHWKLKTLFLSTLLDMVIDDLRKQPLVLSTVPKSGDIWIEVFSIILALSRLLSPLIGFCRAMISFIIFLRHNKVLRIQWCISNNNAYKLIKHYYNIIASCRPMNRIDEPANFDSISLVCIKGVLRFVHFFISSLFLNLLLCFIQLC